jgi:hypothetical protein
MSVLGLPFRTVIRVVTVDGGEQADGWAWPRQLALRTVAGVDVPHWLTGMPFHDRPLGFHLAQYPGRVVAGDVGVERRVGRITRLIPRGEPLSLPGGIRGGFRSSLVLSQAGTDEVHQVISHAPRVAA